MNEADRALCLTGAQFLRAVQQIAPLALGLAAAALLADARGGAGIGSALTLLLVLAERALALRLAFDARLFALLANGALPTLGAMDHALATLGLRSASAEARSLADRLAGTRRLLAQYLGIVALLAVLAAALWLG